MLVENLAFSLSLDGELTHVSIGFVTLLTLLSHSKYFTYLFVNFSSRTFEASKIINFCSPRSPEKRRFTQQSRSFPAGIIFSTSENFQSLHFLKFQ